MSSSPIGPAFAALAVGAAAMLPWSTAAARTGDIEDPPAVMAETTTPLSGESGGRVEPSRSFGAAVTNTVSTVRGAKLVEILGSVEWLDGSVDYRSWLHGWGTVCGLQVQQTCELAGDEAVALVGEEPSGLGGDGMLLRYQDRIATESYLATFKDHEDRLSGLMEQANPLAELRGLLVAHVGLLDAARTDAEAEELGFSEIADLVLGFSEVKDLVMSLGGRPLGVMPGDNVRLEVWKAPAGIELGVRDSHDRHANQEALGLTTSAEAAIPSSLHVAVTAWLQLEVAAVLEGWLGDPRHEFKVEIEGVTQAALAWTEARAADPALFDEADAIFGKRTELGGFLPTGETALFRGAFGALEAAVETLHIVIDVTSAGLVSLDDPDALRELVDARRTTSTIPGADSEGSPSEGDRVDDRSSYRERPDRSTTTTAPPRTTTTAPPRSTTTTAPRTTTTTAPPRTTTTTAPPRTTTTTAPPRTTTTSRPSR